MRDKRQLGWGLLVAGVLAGYFGLYFLAADYVDVGDNTPLYLVQYRVGPISLRYVSVLFEPARRLDEACFRRKHGTVVD